MKADIREEGRCSTNVFVKFLSPEVDDACLQELFAPFGRIESAKVMVDSQTWHTLGFGYISTPPIKEKYHKEREEKRLKEKSIYINKYMNRFVKYSRREEALLAIEKMAGYKIGNKTLMCKLSSSSTSPASCNLYIKPLPASFSEGIPSLLSSPLSSISPSLALTRRSLSLITHYSHSSRLTPHSPSALTPIPLLLSLSVLLSFSHIDTLRGMFIKYGAINTVKIVRDPNQNDVIGLVRYPERKERERKKNVRNRISFLFLFSFSSSSYWLLLLVSLMVGYV